jgi:hypothetical protein
MFKKKCPHCGVRLGDFIFADACPHCHEVLKYNLAKPAAAHAKNAMATSWPVRAFRRLFYFEES